MQGRPLIITELLSVFLNRTVLKVGLVWRGWFKPRPLSVWLKLPLMACPLASIKSMYTSMGTYRKAVTGTQSARIDSQKFVQLVWLTLFV